MQWFTDKESLMLLLEILVLTLLAGLSMPLWPPMGAVFVSLSELLAIC